MNRDGLLDLLRESCGLLEELFDVGVDGFAVAMFSAASLLFCGLLVGCILAGIDCGNMSSIVGSETFG